MEQAPTLGVYLLVPDTPGVLHLLGDRMTKRQLRRLAVDYVEFHVPALAPAAKEQFEIIFTTDAEIPEAVKAAAPVRSGSRDVLGCIDAYPKWRRGRYRTRIWLLEGLDAHETALTLLHEVGHWLLAIPTGIDALKEWVGPRPDVETTVETAADQYMVMVLGWCE